jgi:hypothetical protein
MVQRLCRLVVLSLLAFAGCGPQQPSFSEIASTIPPMPLDRGRIYFYRDYEPYESLSRPPLYLNGQVAGTSIPGGVFYRDVPSGTYAISVRSTGAFADQLKTITVRPAEIYYAKVESLASSDSTCMASRPDTFVVMLADAERARRELTLMRYVQAEEPAEQR